MKISTSWLREYVDHGLAPDDLAERLTMLGLEVEAVEGLGETAEGASAFEGVVVGHVLDTRPHPNADRLTLCDVDLGDGEPVQIVCGAPNVAPGQRVPVATTNTTLMLPDRKNPSQRAPVTITRSKLRGEISNGMICAEDELGLSDDHSGIMVLDPDAEPGQPFADYLAARGHAVADTVLDVAITPNRPDATSHIGVARDVAALTGKPLKTPVVHLPDPGGPVTEQARITIEDPDGCGRYVGLLIRDVKIGDSPAWLKQRLTAIGLRPRNNVVDVTNYVMHECGQPLHAFDFDRLAGGAIIIRSTAEPSTFTTLDSKERVLPAGTLMICDAEQPVAIAGVMGGENSEVSPSTVNVLLESAYFDPSTIRKTAKALNLQTDASYRFERGVDPRGQAWAAARAAALIAALGGGTLVPGMIDEHPRPVPVHVVKLRPARVKKVLGVAIPEAELKAMLEALGFEMGAGELTSREALGLTVAPAVLGLNVVDPSGGAFSCVVPSFRPDVTREIDLIEEVARLYGYDRIPTPTRTSLPYAPPQQDPAETLRSQVLATFRGLGFRESYTNSLLPHRLAEQFSPGGPEAVVGTVNPVSQEMTTLRPRLLPGVLRIVAYNQNHGRDAVRFMEFGHVFQRTEAADVLIPGYQEREHLLLALSGPMTPAAWDTPARAADLFDLKGLVTALFDMLRIEAGHLTPAEPTAVAEQRLIAEIDGAQVGTLGRVTSPMAEQFDLNAPVWFAELDWESLVEHSGATATRPYEAISRFPLVERDLAVIVAAHQPAGEVLQTIRQSGSRLLQSVELFDVYEGDPIAAGKKSLAFTLRFGADRTLVDAEVDQQMTRILKRLEQAYDASLR